MVGGPRPYNVGLYRRMRSAVERFFGWIKSFRRIIIRYERLESTYKAQVTIASIIIHLRIRNLEMSSLYVGPVGALIRNG
jgi:transposase